MTTECCLLKYLLLCVCTAYEILQESCDSTLQRVLQGIRENPIVKSDCGHTAPLNDSHLSRQSLPGKENFTPNIDSSEPLGSPFSLSKDSLELPPHHVTTTASSSECSSGQSAHNRTSDHHLDGHTGKEFSCTRSLYTKLI